jgi:hypothetical protein
VNYTRHYEILVDRAKLRVLDVYTEGHHVIPRCMRGTDEPENIVRLTPEEHYVAHQLLVRMFPEERGLVFALLAMGMNKAGRRPNNKQFGWIRRRVAAAIREHKTGVPRPREMMEKIWAGTRGRKAPAHEIGKMKAALTGRKLSPEHVAAVSAALKGRKSPMTGRQHSEETKAKMREAAFNRRHTPETRAKLAAGAASQTQEQRSARAHKAWETKRAKAAAAARST